MCWGVLTGRWRRAQVPSCATHSCLHAAASARIAPSSWPQARTPSFTTCARPPSRVPTWCSLRQRLSSSRASPPGSLYVAMARKQSFQVCPLAWRPRVTRLRAPTFPGGGQQGFLWRIHRALLGACEARARESVLEELPAISDRGGVGGGVRAKQNDRRVRGSRGGVGEVTAGAAKRKGRCRRGSARERRLRRGGGDGRSNEASGFK